MDEDPRRDRLPDLGWTTMAIGAAALTLASALGPAVRTAYGARWSGVVAAASVLAGVMLLVGGGLVDRRPWSRPSALGLSTLLGVVLPWAAPYTLYAWWVLVDAGSRSPAAGGDPRR